MALGLALILATSTAAAALPLNPDVSQGTIQQTICRPGYSATVRPSTTYTNAIKRRLMAEQGFPTSEIGEYALDHHLAIALGGHPRSLGNLQLLSKHDNARKSRIEVKLLCYVCTGAMPLEQAQAEVWADWTGTYHRYARQKCRR
jgi:hypothetical protein